MYPGIRQKRELLPFVFYSGLGLSLNAEPKRFSLV